jgi:hypothetical protein
MTTMLGFLPLVAGSAAGAGSSALASSFAEGSGDVVAGVVLFDALGLELFLLSPPDLANWDEQAMMPPIIAKAMLAATVVLSLNTKPSFLGGGKK